MNLALTDTQKIDWLAKIAILANLVMMLYAPQLWINTKEFPVIPLFNWLPAARYPLDYLLAGLFFAIQLGYVIKPKKWLGWSLIILYLYLAFIDQNRLQPYFYQSILTVLFVEIFRNRSKKDLLVAIAFLFIATYFWSGMHKLNAVFYEQWMHALQKHFNFIPEKILHAFTYAVPWLEAAMGVLLFIPKLRKITVAFIIGMHSIIIVLLIYLGYGYNVIPWNVQNILSVYILFWSFQTLDVKHFFSQQFNYKKSIILLFTVLLPFSNLFGGWDHLLSFSFFTSKLNYYYIEIAPELKEKLPEHIHKYYKIHEGKTILYPNDWAGAINKVLLYPEDRVIQKTATYLRSFADDPQKEGLIKLVVYNQ
tara:strand:- start:21662 stop:22756 length:1095 start_codon:yes stop_codon:yes gene_type:complete